MVQSNNMDCKQEIKVQFSEQTFEPELPEPLVVQEPVVQTSFSDRLAMIAALQLKKLKIDKELTTQFKNLGKNHIDELKESLKKTKKQKRVQLDPENPTGITRPVPISDTLASFLGLEKGIKISRPEVTRKISNYLIENNLKNPENKSIFQADAAIENLLGVPRFLIDKKKPELGNGFSNTNLQTYLKDHFIKSAS